jgi:putative spermidine/putrescine transport system permease protein
MPRGRYCENARPWASNGTVFPETVKNGCIFQMDMVKKNKWTSIVGLVLVRHRWILISPLLIYLFIFFVVPLSRGLFTSFWDPEFTLKNYVHFFTEPVYVMVIINSFKIAATVTLISLVLAYPYAYLLSSVSDDTASKLLLFVILPFWVSLLVRNYSWMILLGRHGVLNSILLNLDLVSKPVKLLYCTTGVNIGMVHIMLPYMILSLFSVMKGIDLNLMKAAQSLGANRFHTFFRVFLPLSLPGIAGGCLIVFIMSIGFFITPALLGGAKDVMIAQLIEKNVSLMLKWGFAFAAAFVLLVLTIVILTVYNRFLGLDRLMGGSDE